ncbi:MAG TPA: M56 family metallopeptidase [Luteibacter sp.]|jgi:beta-lactamase regulating signal transducer with metallopeptidase domain|nr:M56 family metallopeptidase [Luteibacter sp.]
METFNDFAVALLCRLAWTSIQAALLIGVLAFLTRYVPRVSPAARCAMWWLLGLQLIVGIAWHMPMQLPVLSPATTVVTTTHVIIGGPVASGSVVNAIATPSMNWMGVVALLWLAALAVQLGFAALQWRQVRRVLRESRPLEDMTVRLRCDEEARQLGLRRLPALRVADGIASPHVVGLWQPTILLPTSGQLSAVELDMALSHELAHLRRGDLWLGWVPALAQRLFFFHPLVRWAMHEYALSREEACDADVLRRHDTTADTYGRLLLRLGVQPAVCTGLGTASPTFKNLKRRLIMLQKHASEPRQRAIGWIAVVAIAIAGVVPYRVTAGTTPPAPATSVTSSTSTSSTTHDTVTVNRSRRGQFTIVQSAQNAFTLFDGNFQISDGTMDDADAADRARKGNESMLWIRRGSDTYAVRDAATIAKIRALYAPQIDISERQAALGRKQAALGSRQAELGTQQAKIGSAQASIGQHEAELAAKGRSPSVDPSIARSQSELSDKMRDLSDKQRDLGAQQAELGRQQGVIGEDQRKISDRIDREVASAIDQIVKSNVAQRLADR